MKHILTIALLAAFIAVPSESDAQGFLKNIKQKAEKTIENKVAKMMNGKTNNNSNIVPVRSDETVLGDADETDSYLYGHVTYDVFSPDIEEDEQSAISFETYSDAVKAAPVMPTADDLSSYEARKAYYDGKVKSVEIALNVMGNKRLMAAAQRSLGMGAQPMPSQTPTGGQQRQELIQQIMPSPAEMMEAIQKAGIDMDNATEEQMMKAVAPAIAKKWGVSEDECLKVLEMCRKNPQAVESYMQNKFPALYAKLSKAKPVDAPEEMKESDMEVRYIEINQEVADTLGAFIEALNNERLEQLTVLQQANGTLDEESKASTFEKEWNQSETRQQIIKMENDLSKRLEAWMEANNKGYNDPMPAFWVEGRKAQNKLIDEYNARQAASWIAEATKEMALMKARAEWLASVDAQIETMKAESGETFGYKTCRNTVDGAITIIMEYVLACKQPLSMPLVDHVLEEMPI